MRPDLDNSERGSGTVLVLALVAALGLICVAIMAIGAAGHTSQRAQAAADLGALAAASAIQTGYEPCPLAAEAAQLVGVDLIGCDILDGGLAQVETRATLRGVPAWLGGQARARARAGPRGSPR